VIKQDRELPGFQRVERRVGGLGPPLQAALGEALEAKPEACPVIDQQFERRAGAVSENEQGAREGVLFERPFAQGEE